MKRLLLLLLLLPSLCFAQAQFTLGPSYITESNPNLETKRQFLAWSVTGMIVSPDAFADYKVTFFQDVVQWHRIEVGINTNRNFKPFFSCDWWNNKAHAGGGLRLIYPVERMYVDLTAGAYDSGYLVSGRLGLNAKDSFLDIGYEVDRKEDYIYSMPMMRFGLRF